MSRAALLLFGIVFLARSAAGATFAVTATHDAPDATPGNGVCATAAGPCTLRAAIQEANATAAADSIVLPAGTFTIGIAGADEDAAATGDLDVTAPLTITGAGGTSIIDGAGLDRIFDVRAGAALFDASSMTLRNGRVLTATGGAMRVNLSQPVVMRIREIAFTSNRAMDGGALATIGARYEPNFLPELSIQRSTFENNQATGSGGALHHYGAALVSIAHSRFTANQASDGGAFSWLGFPVYGGRVTTEWSTFANNTASGDGGAMRINGFNGDFFISRTTFIGNRARRGGALATCCTVNSVQPIPYATTFVRITLSTISGNDATEVGGAGYLESGSSFLYVTIVNNTAALTGGLQSSGEPPGLFFSILANPGGNCGPSQLASPRYTITSDTTCGPGALGTLTNTDPKLAPLADNGGPTLTHAPLPGSPAIDFIPNGATLIAEDQRGALRPAGIGVDAGSVEVTHALPIETSIAVAASPNPVVTGRAIVLSPRFTPAAAADHGLVVFRDGTTILGTTYGDPLTIPSLPPGTHAITAEFSGALAYAPSTSAPFDLIVVASEDGLAVPIDRAALLALIALLALTALAILRR